MKTSINSDFFYHMYPLGMCGAPERNDFSSPAGNGLIRVCDQIPHLKTLGISAVYLGPLFESTAHGYDTLDYYHVDRRLGTNEDLKKLIARFHENGISVVLDGVFNHTGRDFFAFRDLQEKGESSIYRSWFLNVDFGKRSPAGDRFSYEGWSGHYDLVKLNTSNKAVREHLFGAVKCWIEDFGIDGIRLDAADVLEGSFMDSLAAFCVSLKPDFWLLGEVVHGDYRTWTNENRLDSVTNYEVYKGLWSSLNDANFFEIAWSLNRQSGPEGIYRHLSLYNFVDNHDVNRVASLLKKQSHLFPLYGMLFTIPGIPSLYYGSEWGFRGEKKNGSDAEMRPALSFIPDTCKPAVDSVALEKAIQTFARIRREHPALQKGTYRQVHVSSEQFVFLRREGDEQILVAVNAADANATLTAPIGEWTGSDSSWKDALEGQSVFKGSGGKLTIMIPASWLRILVRIRN